MEKRFTIIAFDKNMQFSAETKEELQKKVNFLFNAKCEIICVLDKKKGKFTHITKEEKVHAKNN